MSNKPHLRPHQKKRRASRITGLLVAILIVAILALGIALEATGHVVFRGRLILLRGAAVDVAVPAVRASRAAEMGSSGAACQPRREARLRPSACQAESGAGCVGLVGRPTRGAFMIG
jgi:hypothetical protein